MDFLFLIRSQCIFNLGLKIHHVTSSYVWLRNRYCIGAGAHTHTRIGKGNSDIFSLKTHLFTLIKFVMLSECSIVVTNHFLHFRYVCVSGLTGSNSNKKNVCKNLFSKTKAFLTAYFYNENKRAPKPN